MCEFACNKVSNVFLNKVCNLSVRIVHTTASWPGSKSWLCHLLAVRARFFTFYASFIQVGVITACSS